MKIVIQRVTQCSLMINSQVHSSIESGLVVLLGVSIDDTREDAEYLAAKLVGLRIFDDNQGIMNLDIRQISGDIMVVSQFTLQASTRKGNRPSYIAAARGQQANELYEYFVSQVALALGKEVKTGIFGADMKVSLTNDGPVTIIIDSKNK